MKSPFIYIVVLITIFYWGAGFWYHGQIQNYIPDPRYGITWGILLTEPLEFYIPAVLIVVFSLALSGGIEYVFVGIIYLVVVGVAAILKLIWFTFLYLSCGRYDTFCSFVPTDFTQPNPTTTDVWLTIYVFQVIEVFLIIVPWSLSLALIEKWARQEQNGYLQYLLKKAGYERLDSFLITYLLQRLSDLEDVKNKVGSINTNVYSMGRQLIHNFNNRKVKIQ